MRTSTQLYILVFAIIFAVILPPILCYIFIVRPADHTAGQDTSTNTGNERTSTEGLDTTDAAKSFTILIDPGHGGFDPGKVSPDGIMEKDINLAIASKLASALTDQGFSVYLTRDSDKSLNSENASSKKTSDLKARTNLATNVNADLYISIHQNSYSAEYVHGAQVFITPLPPVVKPWRSASRSISSPKPIHPTHGRQRAIPNTLFCGKVHAPPSSLSAAF